MSKPLSPAAQAVLDAFYRELPPDNQRGGLAAALRAAVDQVVPDQQPWRRMEGGSGAAKHEARLAFLAIVTELKSSNA